MVAIASSGSSRSSTRTGSMTSAAAVRRVGRSCSRSGPLFRRRPDNSGIGHGGVCMEQRLDLDRPLRLSTCLDHVLETIIDASSGRLTPMMSS